MIVPMQTAEFSTAVCTKGYLRKCMSRTEALSASMNIFQHSAPCDFFLHLHENLFAYNGGVAVLYVILRHNTVILYTFLVKKIYGIGFLQKCITHILFIFKDFADAAVMPSCISPRRFYFVTFQPSADSQNALSFQVLSENTLDYLRLFLVDQAL